MRLLLALALLAGCADGAQVDVRLLHSDSLRTAELDDMTVRFLGSDGEEVSAGMSPAGSLDASREVFEAGELVVGRTYVVEVSAGAGPACARGRAVGRSRPFVHREESYDVPVHFGCADEFMRAPNPPSFSRLAHRLVTTGDGDAVVVGGADTLTLNSLELSETTIEVTGAVAAVERYEDDTAQFVTLDDLVATRSLPEALALSNGSVAVVGGATQSLPACETSIELVVGSGVSPSGSTAYQRCAPRAVQLSAAGRVLIVGGLPLGMRSQREHDYETRDATTRNAIEREITGIENRANAQVVALADGQSALVVGGTPGTLSNAPAELVRFGPGCAHGCVEAVPVDTVRDGVLRDMTATYVACDAGGGAVFIVGGSTHGSLGRLGLPNVWCYPDRGQERREFRTIGMLPGKRYAHQTVLLEESSRLLVIGGLRIDENLATTDRLPYDDALVIPVDACGCTIDEEQVETIATPIDGLLIGHAATRLGDGTVLLMGGAQAEPLSDFTAVRATATGEAAIFVPDLVP